MRSSDIATMDTADGSSSSKSRVLEYIEVHQDAIIIAQDPQPLTQDLETALASLSVSDRQPLGEIDVSTLQHSAVEHSQIARTEQTKINAAPLSKCAVSSHSLPSSPRRSTPLRKQHNISPPRSARHNSTTQINRTTRRGVGSMTGTTDTTTDLDSSAIDESFSPLPTRLVAETSDRAVNLQHREISAAQQGQGDRYELDDAATSVDQVVSTPARKMTAVMQSPLDRRTFSNKENWRPDLTPLRSNMTYDVLEAAVVEAATPPNSQSRPQSATKPSFEDVEQKSASKPVATPSKKFIQQTSAAKPVIKSPPKEVAQTPASESAIEAPSKKAEQTTPRPNSEDFNASTQTVVHSPLKETADESLTDAVETTAMAEDFSPVTVAVQQLTSSVMPERPLTAQSEVTPAVLKKAAPVVRTTKAAQARISLAHGPGTPQIPSWGRPRDTSGTPRTSNLRQALNAARSTSGGSASSASSVSGDEGKKEVFIPHSKPRPMSMIFPAPPPRPQGVKAPTKSTFVLPGEVVAAKLKAAKEEREKKDEGVKSFKARPVPASIRAAPVVRETKTSRARESIGGANDLVHRRAQSVATFRPSSQQGARPASRLSRPPTSDSKTGNALVREVTNTHRSTTSLANISKPRSASPAVFAAKPAMSKGREVFTREIFANAAAEEEKRAKEEATKRARAEAAERSRQLSREWAEKKKQQKAAKAHTAAEKA